MKLTQDENLILRRSGKLLVPSTVAMSLLLIIVNCAVLFRPWACWCCTRRDPSHSAKSLSEAIAEKSFWFARWIDRPSAAYYVVIGYSFVWRRIVQDTTFAAIHVGCHYTNSIWGSSCCVHSDFLLMFWCSMIRLPNYEIGITSFSRVLLSRHRVEVSWCQGSCGKAIFCWYSSSITHRGPVCQHERGTPIRFDSSHRGTPVLQLTWPGDRKR